MDNSFLLERVKRERLLVGIGRGRRTLSDVAVTAWRVACLAYAVILLYWVWQVKDPALGHLVGSPLVYGYSLLVGVYWIGRFATALTYAPTPDTGYRPSVAVLIPAFNEEAQIGAVIDACFASAYPRNRLEVVVVDDGSTDGTWSEIEAARGRHPALVAVRFGENRGKRAAMAVAVARSQGEVCVFVDSDSVIAPDGLAFLVADLRDPRVGAVVGTAEILNKRANVLTRMQQVRYYAAFHVIKASESLFGAVTCASGCFSAYRREALLSVMPQWLGQRFLGVPATYGDDRALTNYILRDHRVQFQSQARVRTVAPHTLTSFLRQQLRWRKSWCRESLLVSRFIWRKHPVVAGFTYVGTALQWAAPIVLAYLLVWRAFTGGGAHLYAMGAFVMAVLYALFYAVGRRSPHWWYGIVFVALYMFVLVWQTYWAALTLRQTGWGTRSSQPARPVSARRRPRWEGAGRARLEHAIGFAMLPATLGVVWAYSSVVGSDAMLWDVLRDPLTTAATHGVAAMGLVAIGTAVVRPRGHSEERHEFFEVPPALPAPSAAPAQLVQPVRVPVLGKGERRREPQGLGPVSPELALVDPELREAALAALRDLDAAST